MRPSTNLDRIDNASDSYSLSLFGSSGEQYPSGSRSKRCLVNSSRSCERLFFIMSSSRRDGECSLHHHVMAGERADVRVLARLGRGKRDLSALARLCLRRERHQVMVPDINVSRSLAHVETVKRNARFSPRPHQCPVVLHGGHRRVVLENEVNLGTRWDRQSYLVKPHLVADASNLQLDVNSRWFGSLNDGRCRGWSHNGGCGWSNVLLGSGLSASETSDSR